MRSAKSRRPAADTRPRKGKVLVLVGVLLPMAVGGMAVGVDTAVTATAKAQLQTVADSAALAGAAALATENRLRATTTNLDAELASARARAIAMAATNRVLNRPAVLLDNPSNGASGDIVAGHLDPANHGSTLSMTDPLSFNSVQVRAYRNAGHTGVVPAFFARILGHRGTPLAVTATATVQNTVVTGFRSVNGANANLLPIVLDKSTYDQMVQGNTTDQYAYSPPAEGAGGFGTVRSGGDGITESKLYPVVTGNPGNWGTVKIGVSNNSTSTLGAQIRYGITPAQLATFPNGTISLDQLDHSTSPPTPYHTFEGDPGISAGIKDDLTSIIGKQVFIPIYDRDGGNGDNSWFRVVKFASVRILDVNFQGNPKYVVVQPALARDPTAITVGSTPEPTWGHGGQVRLYLSR